MTGSAPDLMDFAGDWQLWREIDDRLAGGVARFEGVARFTPAASGLAYEETGTLFLPGAPPMPASRRYRWQAGDAGIDVFFEDGRFFHGFDPSGRPQAVHWCAPDTYCVRYDFSDWPAWSSRWRVNGPRKDYLAENRYCRA